MASKTSLLNIKSSPLEKPSSNSLSHFLSEKIIDIIYIISINNYRFITENNYFKLN